MKKYENKYSTTFTDSGTFGEAEIGLWKDGIVSITLDNGDQFIVCNISKKDFQEIVDAYKLIQD